MAMNYIQTQLTGMLEKVRRRCQSALDYFSVDPDCYLSFRAHDVYRDLVTGRHESAFLMLSTFTVEERSFVLRFVLEQLRLDAERNVRAYDLGSIVKLFAEHLDKFPAWEAKLTDPQTPEYEKYCIQQEMAGLTPLSVHDWRRDTQMQDDSDDDQTSER